MHIATVSLQIKDQFEEEEKNNLKTLSTFCQLGKAPVKSENSWSIFKYFRKKKKFSLNFNLDEIAFCSLTIPPDI